MPGSVFLVFLSLEVRERRREKVAAREPSAKRETGIMRATVSFRWRRA